jgi:adenylate kinase family enzyme
MSVSRPTLVLMAGLPGAGKTTLAYALGRELGWQIIDKDMYKEALVKHGLDEEYAGKVAYELSFAQVRTLLLHQRISAIFDCAALHTFIIDEVMEILSSADGAQLKVILCVADRDLRFYRLRTRRYQPTSIRVDPATIPDYLRQFEHLPQNKLIIQTNVPLFQYIGTAKEYLKIETQV